MTEKEMHKKAYEKFPDMHPEYFHMRDGYVAALEDFESLPKLNGWWVARDKNGELHVFEVEPRRTNDYWWDRDYDSLSLNKEDFPEIEWENEPVRVKLTITKI